MPTNFRDGTLDPRQIDKRLQRRMVQVDTVTSGDSTGYALGVHVTGFRNLRMIAHDGSWAGFRSLFAVFPDAGFGVVVLTNSSSLEATTLGVRLAEIYLGIDPVSPQDSSPLVADSQSGASTEGLPNSSSGSLRQFEGSFYSLELESVCSRSSTVAWWRAIGDEVIAA